MSDIEVTKITGLLDLLEPGDDVMAERGFTLQKMLAEKGVTLTIPDFLRYKWQFLATEIEHTEQIIMKSLDPLRAKKLFIRSWAIPGFRLLKPHQ